ncbi:hypothetical protein FGB62_51g116 [Gracilaria domingensis]|nr:hypothetical protein FGB62_51g116 [Gracilaria domingensis]
MSTAFGTKQISADQHASLAAPARDRSITVDDFIEQPLPADPESDSDADENEPAVTPAQKRPRSPIRRSSSALSFESEAEEDEDHPPPKTRRTNPQVSPSPPSLATKASATPTVPHLQISTSPTTTAPRATAFLSGRSPISPKESSPAAFFKVSSAKQKPSNLPQPLNSPKLVPSPPPPALSSYIFPRSPNAPPLSVDPSASSHGAPPRTTAPTKRPDSSSSATNPASSLKRKPSGTPPAATKSAPFVDKSRASEPSNITLSPAKRSSPAASRASTSPKLPAPTVINLVSSDPEPIAASRKTSSLPPSKLAQPSQPKSSSAAPATSSTLKENNPRSGENPTGSAAHPTSSSRPQRETSDTVQSVPERNPPMQHPVPAALPQTGSVHASQPEQTISGQTNIPPLSHDGLINVHMPKPSDGSDWDRFVFFKHRPQRHDFGTNCYLSDYSPFAAVAPAVANEPPATLCAVCGGGSNLVTCDGCVCAFHAKCMAPYQVASPVWYCKGCRAAGVPHGNAAPIPDPPSNLSLAAQALHRPIIDAKEGNPMDLVLHPSLLTLFRDHYAGNDWLQCFSCKRRRVVPNGILSESVQIPFQCNGMFWLAENEQNCTSQMDANSQRIEQYINRQAELRGERRKALLESFGDGADDESEGSLEDDPSNVKLPAKPIVRLPEQPNNPGSNHVTIPNGISAMAVAPKTTPPHPPSTEHVVLREKPISVQQPLRKVATANGFAPMEVDTDVPEQPNHSTADPVSAVNATATITTQQQSATEVKPTTASETAAAQPKTEAAKQEDSIGGSNSKAEDVQQELLMYIAELELDEPMEDALTDLALSNDKTLAQIYIAFRSNKDRFKRQAVRYAKRKAKAS